MQYFNTRNPEEKVSFKDAVVKGLADDKGLYMPESIPQLPDNFWKTITDKSDLEIAMEVIYPYVSDDLNKETLEKILAGTLSFSTPVVNVKDNIYSLELFHGPTMAFKDVGARFMSRCLGQFKSDQKVTVLVATSGDTGSAVANGFWKIDGVDVLILFPKGKVSAFQEYQMTSLGHNIHTAEVEGAFDDCQTLVKQALCDPALKAKMQLSSANSINIARLLPQMLYYFFAYKQLQEKHAGQELVVCVPSGNFGNLTAGLVAKRMGLPVQHFIAATNANDTFTDFMKTGEYNPKPSVMTYSNAMDVGAPSNFERLHDLYNKDIEAIREDISSFSVSDEETLVEIKKTYEETSYILDPHGAVGKIALEKVLKPNQVGVFLETAHPKKFDSVVEKALPDADLELEPIAAYTSSKVSIANDYNALLSILNA
ncbi:MAG: threonine synthase [Aureispira sp.]|nr:threonine synthase [Aureispira sp.]